MGDLDVDVLVHGCKGPPLAVQVDDGWIREVLLHDGSRNVSSVAVLGTSGMDGQRLGGSMLDEEL